MKVDIIGSKFTRKLTDFKNFRFEVNNIVVDQSILSLFSEPYEVTMKDINTTDLNDITVAYRDMNKLLYPNLKNSDSDVIIVELLSELNDLSEFNNAYYNASSLKLLDENPKTEVLTNIQKFRALQSYFEAFIQLLHQYETVILLKILPKEKNEKEFVEGLYQLLESKVEHKLLLTVDNSELNDNFEAPLEVYNKAVDDLRKFSSDNYHNQLLFDEQLINETLSVYVNHVKKREYVYELYKNGKPYKSSESTTSRYYEFKLTEPGKYRIRVNLTDNEIDPRFSLTYDFKPVETGAIQTDTKTYIEIPTHDKLWMLNLMLSKGKYVGLVGNPYKYPEGYQGYKVFLKDEINDDEYIKKEDFLSASLNIISTMDKDEYETFLNNNQEIIKEDNKLFIDFLNYIKQS